MKPEALQSLSIFELVGLYVKAAQAYGQAREEAKPRVANKQSDLVVTLRKEFRRRGHEGHAAMARLMTHESGWVRLMAAGFTLHISPTEAEPVLEALTQLAGECGFSASTILDLWRRRELKPPE